MSRIDEENKANIFTEKFWEEGHEPASRADNTPDRIFSSRLLFQMEYYHAYLQRYIKMFGDIMLFKIIFVQNGIFTGDR